MAQRWTQADFEQMSWHDVHVHGLSIVEGRYGAGELILDLDYILEWQCGPTGRAQFRLAPAELRFHEVTELKIALDYATPTAGLTPFALHQIHCETEARGKCWRLEINWPVGEITFAAAGYTQRLTGASVVCDGQGLSFAERERLKRS